MREAAKTIENQIIAWRREIHRHPEIGLETTRTAALVSSALKEMGIEVREGVGGHGVVGLLRGEGSPGQEDSGGRARTIALRADMDALPVQEETGHPYASEVPGLMHACGHDGHVAMLLGAAKILSGMRNSLKGNVKFIFQPGEEGPGGARPMIDDRALEDPRPQAIVGAHLGSLWNVAHGKVGFRAGPLMAATDRFDVLVQGMGGHGAAPHTSVDPVVVASHIVVALQTIVSREINPTEPAVVTVGVIEAGSANNIIPDKCVMKGTVRYMNKDLGPFVSRRIKEIAESMASGMRAEATVQYHFGYPPLVNDAEITERVKMSAAKVVGAENIVVAGQTMGAEDMSYYLDKVPGTFFAIGSSSEAKGIVYPNHHPKFDIDEDVLHLGSAIFVQACLDFLGG
ncbi:MAG: M20 metallopeptidase family protein [Bacillota bacterium]